MKWRHKYSFYLIGGGLLLILITYLIKISIAIDGFFDGQPYSSSDMAENFERNHDKILEAKCFFESLENEFEDFYIEFREKQIYILKYWDGANHYTHREIQLDSAVKVLNWNKDILLHLRDKLTEANTISIERASTTIVGWKRSGMGMYYYEFLNTNLPFASFVFINESCDQIFYKDNIVFRYAGGAIGPQCFMEYN